MNTLKIGVIGAGRMGERHCKTIADLAEVERIAISGIYDSGYRGDVAAKFETRQVATMNELVGDSDLMIVASPSEFHFDHAWSCLIAGKPTLIEKPMTLEAHQATRLISLAIERRIPIAIGQSEVWNPVWRHSIKNPWPILPEAIRSVRFVRNSSSLPPPLANPVDDLMVHDLALAMDLFSSATLDMLPIEILNAYWQPHAVTSMARARFGSHFPILFEAAYDCAMPRRVAEIRTGAALHTVDLLNKTCSVQTGSVGASLDSCVMGDSLQTQLRRFIKHVRAHDMVESLRDARLGYGAVQLAEVIKSKRNTL